MCWQKTLFFLVSSIGVFHNDNNNNNNANDLQRNRLVPWSDNQEFPKASDPIFHQLGCHHPEWRCLRDPSFPSIVRYPILLELPCYCIVVSLYTHRRARQARKRESIAREIRAFWAMTKLTSALFDRCDGRATMTSSVIGIVGQTDRNQNDSWSLFPCLGVVANIVPVSWLICISFGFNNRLLYKLLYPLRCYVGPFRGKFLARCVVCDGLSLDDDVRRGVWLLLFQRNRLTNVQCKSPKTKGVWMESHLLGQRESWIATAACRVVCVC